MIKLIKSSILSVVIILVSVGVQAQTSYKFSSTFVVEKPTDFLKLNKVRNLFDAEMKARGAEYSQNEGFEFLLGVSQKDEYGQIAVSVTKLVKMPENIVQAGKYSQVFYAALEEDDGITRITEAGNMIKDEVSESFMRQFYAVWKQKTVIMDASNLEEEISGIVDEILAEK